MDVSKGRWVGCVVWHTEIIVFRIFQVNIFLRIFCFNENRTIRAVSRVWWCFAVSLGNLPLVAFQPEPFKPAHCLAARALLGWTAADLARRSELSEATIRHFEQGVRVKLRKRTLRDLLRAFEEAGVVWSAEQPGDSHVQCSDGIVVALRDQSASQL